MDVDSKSQPFIFKHPGPIPGASATPAHPATGHANSLVDETQREISDIVREVASASRSEMPPDRYWPLLADRILRAMSAEGVVIWEVAADDTLKAVSRVGKTTDLVIPDESKTAHDRMLSVVHESGSPVVVPSTPGATDPDHPANPTEYPAAVVPVDQPDGGVVDPSAEPATLIEVFLEAGGGVSAQRGYLRFIAQMADLAGEYQRHRSLRILRQDVAWTVQVDGVLQQLRQLNDPRSISEALVDATAELGDFDRVGYVSGPHYDRVVAVSHVDHVDPATDATQHLATIAQMSDDQVAAKSPVSPEDLRLAYRLDVGNQSEDRLLCLVGADRSPFDSPLRLHLQRLASVAGDMIDLRSQSNRRLPRFGMVGRKTGQKAQRLRHWKLLAGLLTIAVILCLPIPLSIDTPAVLVPCGVQRVSTPIDAMVREIHVAGGQDVRRGDLLVSMSSDRLDKQWLEKRGALEAAKGRREALVSQSRSNHDGALRAGQLSPAVQLSLVDTEISNLEDQLRQLSEQKRNLQVTAEFDGYVDAWNWDRLRGQHLTAGQPILTVIPHRPFWTAEVSTPQRRVHDIREAFRRKQLGVTITPVSAPEKHWAGRLQRIGPAIVDGSGEASMVMLVNLGESTTTDRLHEGTPAEAVFRCGDASIAYVLFGDVYASVWGTVTLYLYPLSAE